jgi:hypothetical protein
MNTSTACHHERLVEQHGTPTTAGTLEPVETSEADGMLTTAGTPTTRDARIAARIPGTSTSVRTRSTAGTPATL